MLLQVCFLTFTRNLVQQLTILEIDARLSQMVQMYRMFWHTIEVHEPSTIFEAKDGAYEPPTK